MSNAAGGLKIVNVFARVVSLLAATAIVAVVVLYPRLIAENAAEVPHGFLVLLLIGMSCAWVHGFGFIPQNPILKIAFSPLVAWPVIALGIWGVFLR